MNDSTRPRIRPGLRLIGGILSLAGVLVIDAGSRAVLPAMIILVLATIVLNGVRLSRIVMLILAGGLMYVPVIFLSPLSVALKGFSSTFVVLAAVSGMTAGDLHAVVVRLPVPTFARLLMMQMLHQGEVLRRETYRVHQALSVRGGTRGFRDTWLFVRAIPLSWMPRMIFRAERVALAMDVRGYGSALPQAPLLLKLSGRESWYLLSYFSLAVGAFILSHSGLP
jgi:energy-coupling factor transporter transmembrane protein EcfT